MGTHLWLFTCCLPFIQLSETTYKHTPRLADSLFEQRACSKKLNAIEIFTHWLTFHLLPCALPTFATFTHTHTQHTHTQHTQHTHTHNTHNTHTHNTHTSKCVVRCVCVHVSQVCVKTSSIGKFLARSSGLHGNLFSSAIANLSLNY